MDKKTKIFFTVFFGLIAIVVTVTFSKYFILKDYFIEAQADCDPTVDKCFVWQCDNNAKDESEKCTGDPEKDTWYYQEVEKKAYDIPNCDPNDENCDALKCESGEDCTITLCDDKTKKEDKTCSDPEEYNKEHPASEESDEGDASESCAPDDEECLNAQKSDDTGDSAEDSVDQSDGEDVNNDSSAIDNAGQEAESGTNKNDKAVDNGANQ